jgi:ubiquinone/menaquinone biosynthesis C-methylase UbiE
MALLINKIKNAKRYIREKLASHSGSASYWTSHMVPVDEWHDAKSSMEHFLWRNAQYPGYIDLMPVHGADGLVVVDYGCGPGNDLVGFSEFSKPMNLIGIDVSETALATSKKRLALHDKSAKLIHIKEDVNAIPLESDSVDLVHSSGVLHHAKNLEAALLEIRRILKPNGKFQVMVYNYDSLWLHLYTAFIIQIELNKYKNDSILDAFRQTTDGADCPISHCYRPNDFLKIVENLGFNGKYKGSSISLLELEMLPKRFDAIRSRSLSKEHRDFLSTLQFDQSGFPITNGMVAGIGACYEFSKINVDSI